jgi:hypothetical protein
MIAGVIFDIINSMFFAVFTIDIIVVINLMTTNSYQKEIIFLLTLIMMEYKWITTALTGSDNS